MTSALPPLGPPSPAVTVGYGASFNDVAGFENTISRLQHGQLAGPVTVQAPAAAAPSPALRALLRPLEGINAQAQQLSLHAEASAAGGGTLSPGDTVRLTFEVQKFMFNCQLTSNAANRTSDGLQQLFRQQA